MSLEAGEETGDSKLLDSYPWWRAVLYLLPSNAPMRAALRLTRAQGLEC